MSKLMLKVPNFPGKDKIVGKMARASLQVSKHSPEICLGWRDCVRYWRDCIGVQGDTEGG